MTNHVKGAHRLGVARFAATGAITAGPLLVLCWLGAFLPVSSPTHAYIALLTNAETRSIATLTEATLWSLPFGAVTGALLAWVYNRLAALDRRG